MKKIVRLGCIGCGGFAGTHLAQLEMVKNAKVVAIADINPDHLKEKSEEFGIADTYLDYHDLLAREDIDAVVLPIPDQIHCQVTVDALRAGKHVLCEKPMALDLAECKEMVRVAQETGKQLMVGQIGRYSPAFAKADQLIKDGVLGKVYFIESEYAHDYSGIGGAGGWRVTPEREPIIGGGCHAVDLIRMFMDESPKEVFAYANNVALVGWPIHDCTIAIMKFPSGAVGKVMTSTGCKRKYTMRTVVQGTKGTIIVDDSLPYISLFEDHFSENPEFSKLAQRVVEMRIPVGVNTHNFAAEAQEFCDALLAGTPVRCNGIEGASTVSVCTAIVESFKTGEKVTVDYDFS